MANDLAGIHHLALYTWDLDRTLDFYTSVLGLEVSDVFGSPRGRHAFVHLEPASSGRRGLHFWENNEFSPPDPNAHPSSFSSGPGPLAHVALYQPNTQVVADLRARLDRDDIRVFEFPELGTFGFADPNGIMLEIVADVA